MHKVKAARPRKSSYTTPTKLDLMNTSFERVLSDEQVARIEDSQAEWGMHRRMTLIALARSKQQLVDGFSPDECQDSLLEMIECVSNYEIHCKALLEMAEAAVIRLTAVAATTIGKGATA